MKIYELAHGSFLHPAWGWQHSERDYQMALQRGALAMLHLFGIGAKRRHVVQERRGEERVLSSRYLPK